MMCEMKLSLLVSGKHGKTLFGSNYRQYEAGDQGLYQWSNLKQSES